MSRFVGVLLRATLAAWVCAVALSAARPAGDTLAQDEITLAAVDNGRSLALTEPQELVITLPANPSTGFLWQAVALDSGVLVETDPGALRYVEATTPGVAAQQVLRFRAIGAGTTDLRLSYRRPWETDTAPADTFAVTVIASGPFTGANIPVPTPSPAPLSLQPQLAVEPAYDVYGQALPAHFNWCDQGGCTPVKDQRDCGSCWAFATVGVFELGIKIRDGLTKDLSEQYLLSCNTEGYNCVQGGLWAHRYHMDYAPWGEPAAGAVYESDFPYTARDDPCNSPHPHHERISAWANVPGPSLNQAPTVAAMKQALYEHGPLAVGVCAGTRFTSYTGGVFRTNEAGSCPSGSNHGVVLVGWDDNNGDGYWYLRNSWGAGWGESGYMRIGYGVSLVGENATYIVYGGNTPVSPTATPTRLPTPRPSPIRKVYLPVIARQNVVPAPTPTSAGFLNPGFELGARYWTEYSRRGWELIVHADDLGVSPHNGRWAAWLGGANDEISFIEQRVTVPSSRPYLAYWHWISSEDGCGYDFGGVIVNRTRVVDRYNLCVAGATGGWVRHSVNLGAYRGQTIYLQIRAETDYSAISSLLIDDVSFQATATTVADDLPAGGSLEVRSKPVRSAPQGESTPAEVPRLLGQ
jgi:predicted secreted protein